MMVKELMKRWWQWGGKWYWGRHPPHGHAWKSSHFNFEGQGVHHSQDQLWRNWIPRHDWLGNIKAVRASSHSLFIHWGAGCHQGNTLSCARLSLSHPGSGKGGSSCLWGFSQCNWARCPQWFHSTESSRSKRVQNSCNKEGLLSPTRIRKEIRQWTFQFYLYASKMIFFFLPSCVCVCALLKRVNLSIPLLLHWINVLFDKRAVLPTLAQIKFCWLFDFPGDWSEFFSSSISFLSYKLFIAWTAEWTFQFLSCVIQTNQLPLPMTRLISGVLTNSTLRQTNL